MSSSADSSSSSEIHQGQGFYHDGKNEMAGLPALPEPLSPDQIHVPPEEGIWKKYSAHYEFPLSLLLAVGLHLLAFMIVLAYMAIAFHFDSTRDQPINSNVVIGDPDSDPNKPHNPLAGGRPSGDDPTAQVDQPFKDIPLAPKPTSELPVVSEPNPFLQSLENLLDKPPLNRPGQPSKNNGNRSDKDGPGDGPEDGPGSAYGERLDGPKRWHINMRYDDPEAFVEKLAQLKVVVAARLLNGRFLVFENMPARAPFPYREMEKSELRRFVSKLKCVWFTTQNSVTCDNFAIGANITVRPTTLLLFIPQDLEKGLRETELKHHGLSVEQIKERRLVTTFDVKRSVTGWSITVIKTHVDPNLKH